MPAAGGLSGSVEGRGRIEALWVSGGTGVGLVTNMVDSGGATNKPSRYYRVRVLVP